MTTPPNSEFLDALVSTHSKSAELFEGLYLMNNNSFFSLVAEKKPYKLVSSTLGNILGYNTVLKVSVEEAKYLNTKHGIRHLLGWTIR